MIHWFLLFWACVVGAILLFFVCCFIDTASWCHADYLSKTFGSIPNPFTGPHTTKIMGFPDPNELDFPWGDHIEIDDSDDPTIEFPWNVDF